MNSLEQSLGRGAESKTFSTLPKTAVGWGGEGVASLGRQTNQSHSDQAGVLCARVWVLSSNEGSLKGPQASSLTWMWQSERPGPQIRQVHVSQVSAEQPGGVIWPLNSQK